jgi:arginine exporter protein ArgO
MKHFKKNLSIFSWLYVALLLGLVYYSNGNTVALFGNKVATSQIAGYAGIFFLIMYVIQTLQDLATDSKKKKKKAPTVPTVPTVEQMLMAQMMANAKQGK